MPWSKDDLPPSVDTIAKSEGWSDAQKAKFAAAANAVLDEGESEGTAIATGIDMAREKDNADLTAPMAGSAKAPPDDGTQGTPKGGIETPVITKEKANAKEMPRKLYARHMNNGVASYVDEMILVTTETMKKMCNSFTAMPVYVEHQPVEVGNLQRDAAGYVSRCFYNELDGWLWLEFLVVSDEGHEAIKKGWSVSNAYLPTKEGPGGTCHDVAYDREILEGEFTHLAIVPNPRYEDALIMTPEEFKAYQAERKSELVEMQNAKEQPKDKRVMKFWKKTEVTNAEEIQNVMVTLDNGADVSVSDMIDHVENAAKKKNEADEDKEKKNTDDMVVEVKNEETGEMEKITVTELVNRYQKMNAHADDDEEKENDAEKIRAIEEKAKENADDEDKKIKDKEKENAKHFDELKNAGPKQTAKSEPYTRMDALAAGKAKY